MSSNRPVFHKRHEVAVESFLVVFVALTGDDERAKSILRHAAGPSEIDFRDHIHRRLVPAALPRAGARTASEVSPGRVSARLGCCDCGTVSNGFWAGFAWAGAG